MLVHISHFVHINSPVGAALSAITGFQSQQKLAGIICLSGYLPFKGDFSAAVSVGANSKTPALCCHGTRDNIVKPKAGESLYQGLKSSGVEVTQKLYPMMHSTCEDEMKEVVKFFTERLPKK